VAYSRSRTATQDTSEIQVKGAGRSAVAARPDVILVVEDHQDSRDALRALLEAFGYRVLEASNGREALEVASRHAPDLVLMDIMMPEVDGFEATRELRRKARFKALPIIAVTAMEGARETALKAGVNDFVRKPIDIRTLIAKVRHWLPGQQDA
jgi:CheY-like chemotaxis protein